MPNAYGSYAYATEEYAGPPVANSPYVSTNGGQFPYRYVEVAFGNGPNDASPTWVNVASDVTQIQTRRGRQRTLGRFEPGTATVLLDNKSGKYSPFNPSSPYYGQIRPGMPLRFRAGWGPVTYTEFTGFVESWPLTWPAANDSVLSVTAVDAMKFLNMKKVPALSQYSATVLTDTPHLYWRLGDPPGSSVAADSSGNGRAGTPTTIAGGTDPWFFGADGAIVADPDAAFDAGTATGQVQGGVSVTESAVSFEVWAKLRSLPSSGTPGVGAAATIVSLSNSSGTGQQINLSVNNSFTTMESGVAFVHVDNGVGTIHDMPSQFQPGNDWHHYVVTSDGSFQTIWVDGVYQGSYGIAAYTAALNVVTVGAFDGVVDDVVVYAYKLTGAQALAHYRAGILPRLNETSGTRIGVYLDSIAWPATSRQIDTGNTRLQSVAKDTRSALASMQAVADTENGDLFIDAGGRVVFFDRNHTSRSPYGSVSLILGDSGAAPEEPYRLDSLTVSYDDQDVVNEVEATPAGMAPQIVSDAASQAAYGVRSQSISLLSSTTLDAAGRAAYVLNLSKTPQPRVDSVTVNPADDPTMLFGPVLGSDLLTRIELRRRPLDGQGSTFDQTALIEGIEHKVTKATWETIWRTSTVDATKVGIFNESNFGEGAVFAY